MSEGTGYTNQTYLKEPEVPGDAIVSRWDEDLDITAVAVGEESWLFAMSK